MIWQLKQLQDPEMPQTCINGRWVPSRPLNWKHRSLWERLFEAWQVFKGSASAFKWPEGQ